MNDSKHKNMSLRFKKQINDARSKDKHLCKKCHSIWIIKHEVLCFMCYSKKLKDLMGITS